MEEKNLIHGYEEIQGEADDDRSDENLKGGAGEASQDRDGYAEINLSEDRMAATMILHGPAGSGRDATYDMVMEELKRIHIEYGLDRAKVKDIVESRYYRQPFTIAEGKPVIHGTDGSVKDCFPRTPEQEGALEDSESTELKYTDLIRNVKKGETVCLITLPKPSRDGTDVQGRLVKAHRGAMPPVPQGKNVIYSPEKDRLITACEGNLTYRQGRFQVENVYTVQGNVDHTAGVIDFTGSIIINGDVLAGSTVKAKGDITVHGMVEGASLEAGGSIVLHKGMRGMKSGRLEAGGSITAKFLEDCTIYAHQDIKAEYMINSAVSCGNDLTLVGKRGAFIGGSCSVYHQMSVRSVGAPSRVPTTITLGITPQLKEEIESLGTELIHVSRKGEEMEKDINYLVGREQDGTLTDKQKERLAKMKLEAPLNVMKEKLMKQRAMEVADQIKRMKGARLTAAEVHPGTVISIGDCRLNIVNTEENCSFYYSDGEIKKGIR